VIGAESQHREILDDADSEPTDDHAGNAAEPAENADDESLAEIAARNQGRDRQDRGEQAPGCAGDRGREAEGDGIDPCYVDPHEGRRLGVHPDGDNGSSEPRHAHHQPQAQDEEQRQGSGEAAVERQDNGAELHQPEGMVEHDPAIIRLEGREQDIVQDEIEPEGQRQGEQDRLPHDAIDRQALYRIAQRKQDEAGDGGKEKGIYPEPAIGEKGEISAEDDQRSMQQVDDVEDAPYQREAGGDAAIERAKNEAVDQDLKQHG